MRRAPTAEPLPKRRGARIAARHQARRHVAQSREEAIRAVGRARAADRSVAAEPGRADPAPVRADPALDRDERLSRDSRQRSLLPPSLDGHSCSRPPRAVSLSARLKTSGALDRRDLSGFEGHVRGVVARIVTGPHDAHRQDPHWPMRYDTGRPSSVIRLRISQPRTTSLPCPAGLRARRPSPMMDL